jgi:hypothetical protein
LQQLICHFGLKTLSLNLPIMAGRRRLASLLAPVLKALSSNPTLVAFQDGGEELSNLGPLLWDSNTNLQSRCISEVSFWGEPEDVYQEDETAVWWPQSRAGPMFPLLERNCLLRTQCQDAIYELIKIRKFRRDQCGLLGLVPKELVELMARYVHSSRGDLIWCPLNRRESPYKSSVISKLEDDESNESNASNEDDGTVSDAKSVSIRPVIRR